MSTLWKCGVKFNKILNFNENFEFTFRNHLRSLKKKIKFWVNYYQ